MSSPAGKNSHEADRSSTTSRRFLTPPSRGMQRLSPSPQTLPNFQFSQGSETTPRHSSPSQAFSFSFGGASSPAVQFNSSPTPPLQLFPDTSRTQINADFTFRSLHNASPTPSPQPSPRQSARPTPAQPLWLSQPDFNFSSLTFNEKQATPSVDSTAERPLGPELLFAHPNLGSGNTNSVNQDSNKLNESTISTAVYEPVPYNVLDEQAPAHPLFTATFQSALKAGTDIAKAMASTIRNVDPSLDSDHDLQRFLQDAEELSSFSSHDTRTIAVLGDSGQGRLF